MIVRCRNLSAILASIGVVAMGQPTRARAAEPQAAVAVVAGQTISEDDLLPLIQAQVRQLRTQEYELKTRALDSLIFQKLVEAEAKRLGATTEKLLEQEVNAKAGEPSESDVESYYLGQKDRINRPIDEVRPQIRQALKQARVQQARDDFYRRLRATADVSIRLSPPRTDVAHDPSRLKGSAAAAVRIVEFSDFQCPFCQRAQAVIQEVLAKYGDKVSLSFRDFPLRDIHPLAQKAAEASRCMLEQGKFWQYHDLLFARSPKLETANLIAYAKEAGGDVARFEGCLASGKHAPAVQADVQEGTKAGVSGTPGFFVNGIFMSGAQPLVAFQKIIDSELAQAPVQKSQ